MMVLDLPEGKLLECNSVQLHLALHIEVFIPFKRTTKVLVKRSDWISHIVLSDLRVSHRGPLILGPWVTSMGWG